MSHAVDPQLVLVRAALPPTPSALGCMGVQVRRHLRASAHMAIGGRENYDTAACRGSRAVSHCCE